MRTIIDIPDNQVLILNQLAYKKKVSRAEVIRQALNDYLAIQKKTSSSFDKAFGCWRNNHIKNGLLYQESLRSEWDK